MEGNEARRVIWLLQSSRKSVKIEKKKREGVRIVFYTNILSLNVKSFIWREARMVNIQSLCEEIIDRYVALSRYRLCLSWFGFFDFLFYFVVLVSSSTSCSCAPPPPHTCLTSSRQHLPAPGVSPPAPPPPRLVLVFVPSLFAVWFSSLSSAFVLPYFCFFLCLPW